MTQQVEVCLTIGRYNDKVLCDVVPMEATQVLLGRPWQYDTKAVHDGFTNKISFKQDDKKIFYIKKRRKVEYHLEKKTQSVIYLKIKMILIN